MEISASQTRRFISVARLVYTVSIFSHGIIAIAAFAMGEGLLGAYTTGSTILYAILAMLRRPQFVIGGTWFAFAEVCGIVWLLMAYYEAGAGAASLLLVLITAVFFVPVRAAMQIGVGAVLTIYVLGILYYYNAFHGSPLILIIEYSAVWITAVFLGMLAYIYNRVAAQAESALEVEHEKSERLLYNALPPGIAIRLKEQEVVADRLDNVTVLFADIAGFTAMAGQLEPEQLVRNLDELFRRFDRIMDEHGLEKIKTIGDAYMAAAGVPEAQKDHALRAAAAARAMLADLEQFNEGHTLPGALSLRIGLCSGPVLAGVIGEQRLAYDLWGDTVNVAARMESTGEAGRIQVPESTYLLLREHIQLAERGYVEVKGKGSMPTWFLE